MDPNFVAPGWFVILAEAVTWLWLRLADRKTQKQLAKIVVFPLVLARQIKQYQRSQMAEANLMRFTPKVACTKTLVYKFHNGIENYQSEEIHEQAQIIRADASRRDWLELVLDFSDTDGTDYKERIHLIKLLKAAFPRKQLRIHLPANSMSKFIHRFSNEVKLILVDVDKEHDFRSESISITKDVDGARSHEIITLAEDATITGVPDVEESQKPEAVQ